MIYNQKHKMTTVAVIIVNYNAGHLLAECLKSLDAQTIRPSRVLVMDNGSRDGSFEHCRADFHWVEFHALNDNLGFAKANNLAVELLTDCEWIALLNPDAFAEPRWIEAFMDCAHRHPDVDTFASCMVSADRPDIIDGAGDAYRIDGVAWPRFKEMVISSVPIGDHEVFSPCAGAGFYRRSRFLELGGFCERYFCYHEDVDLGFRLRSLGTRCVLVRDAVVRHVGSAISGKGSDFSVYHVQRNIVWTFVRNMPDGYFWLYLPAHLLLNVASLLYFLIYCRRSVVWRAKRDAVKALPQVWEERRRIQAGRRVSAETVVAAMEHGTILSSIVPKLMKRLGA